MSQLIRIIYISRSTFKPAKSKEAIEPNVGRILAQSRVNNRRNGLVGVLYFGDGCFFQCLEGEQSTVDALYARLQADKRHKDLKLLLRENIASLTYSEWAMKFVPLERPMTRLLKENGMDSFDPYRFDPKLVQKVMGLLRTSAPDRRAEAAVAVMIDKSLAAPAGAKTPRALLLTVGLACAAVVAALAWVALRT